MKALWVNKTGAAKFVAIFSTSLLLALGLCGVNFFAVLRFVPFDGAVDPVHPTAQERNADLIGNILSVTGFLEIAVILISVVGLVFALVARASRGSSDDADEK